MYICIYVYIYICIMNVYIYIHIYIYIYIYIHIYIYIYIYIYILYQCIYNDKHVCTWDDHGRSMSIWIPLELMSPAVSLSWDPVNRLVTLVERYYPYLQTVCIIWYVHETWDLQIRDNQSHFLLTCWVGCVSKEVLQVMAGCTQYLSGMFFHFSEDNGCNCPCEDFIIWFCTCCSFSFMSSSFRTGCRLQIPSVGSVGTLCRYLCPYGCVWKCIRYVRKRGHDAKIWNIIELLTRQKKHVVLPVSFPQTSKKTSQISSNCFP